MPPPTKLSDLRPGRTLKLTYFAAGTAVFLGAGACLAAYTRHYQSLALPLPGNSGRSMSYPQAYGIASAMCLVSIVYAWMSWKLVCSRRG
jgi:hypothetical protein